RSNKLKQITHGLLHFSFLFREKPERTLIGEFHSSYLVRVGLVLFVFLGVLDQTAQSRSSLKYRVREVKRYILSGNLALVVLIPEGDSQDNVSLSSTLALDALYFFQIVRLTVRYFFLSSSPTRIALHL